MKSERNDTPEDICPEGELLVYQGPGLDTPVEVRLEGETVWLSQKLMARLYGTTVANINQHISAIYEDEELRPEATIKKYLIVQTEGNRQVKRLVDFYDLQMIIAVGFRVRSKRGVQFRQWANARISEYLVKGFVLDDKRLKGNASVTDYFDELLARIREIRASEARVYLMIRNIFALAVDYQEDDKKTSLFFAMMQNKMHYAATGLTAAEIVKTRANAERPNMGLTSWKGSRVLKSDVSVAKNYLAPEEIDTLNRITVMFLDQAEFRAQRQQTIQLADWTIFLDKFLTDMELPLLRDSGKVERSVASHFAEEQYVSFAKKRQMETESQADQNYLNELDHSAKLLADQRKKRSKVTDTQKGKKDKK